MNDVKMKFACRHMTGFHSSLLASSVRFSANSCSRFVSGLGKYILAPATKHRKPTMKNTAPMRPNLQFA